jgi:hypothetical protein
MFWSTLTRVAQVGSAGGQLLPEAAVDYRGADYYENNLASYPSIAQVLLWVSLLYLAIAVGIWLGRQHYILKSRRILVVWQSKENPENSTGEEIPPSRRKSSRLQPNRNRVWQPGGMIIGQR